MNIIAANWKMNLDKDGALLLANEMISVLPKDIEIIICPPFVYLDSIRKIFSDSHIKLGAQNMHFENSGAFTGEISPVMLRSCGCEYVILGHSERRHIFKEDDAFINKKVKSALKYNLKPIVCIGEMLNERQSDIAFEVVRNQIENSLDGVEQNDVILAYEPVWAIGTGIAADEETISQMHQYIKSVMKTTLLYGGSVKPENTKSIGSIDGVDGFLVGGASLLAQEFKQIIEEFIKVKE